MRAAISIFKDLWEGPETEAIKTELKWLTDQLGPARDFDVLVDQRVRPLRKATPIADEIGVLERDLEVKRDAGLDEALDGRRRHKAAYARDRGSIGSPLYGDRGAKRRDGTEGAQSDIDLCDCCRAAGRHEWVPNGGCGASTAARLRCCVGNSHLEPAPRHRPREPKTNPQSSLSARAMVKK